MCCLGYHYPTLPANYFPRFNVHLTILHIITPIAAPRRRRASSRRPTKDQDISSRGRPRVVDLDLDLTIAERTSDMAGRRRNTGRRNLRSRVSAAINPAFVSFRASARARARAGRDRLCVPCAFARSRRGFPKGWHKSPPSTPGARYGILNGIGKTQFGVSTCGGR